MKRPGTGGIVDSVVALRRAMAVLDATRKASDEARSPEEIEAALLAERVGEKNVIGAARDLLASLDASGL